MRSDPVAIYAAALSTVNVVALFYGWSKRRAVRLTSFYSWTDERGVDDEITLVNLGEQPILIAAWRLVWVSRRVLSRSKPIDVTPIEAGGRLSIPGKTERTITFDDRAKFVRSYRMSESRKLVMIVWMFDRRRAKRITIRWDAR